MSEADAALARVLRADDPPARDVAFTMRVLEEAARDAARRRIRGDLWRLLVGAAAAALAAPAFASLAAQAPAGDVLLLAGAAVLAAAAFTRLLRRIPAAR